MDELQSTIEEVFRRESGRIIAGLIRASGSFDLAEEALQDAFSAALAKWPAAGVPGNPSAWITTVAKRKLVDYVRRERTRNDNQDQLLYECVTSIQPGDGDDDSMDVSDDRLRLMFTCCHPALNTDAKLH